MKHLRSVLHHLNLYVHTVTDQAMFHYLSLGVFPQYVPERAEKLGAYILRVANAILFSIVLGLRNDMFLIHHRNREIILAGLEPNQRVQFNDAG